MTRDAIEPDEARKRLYDVMRSDEPFEEQVERALSIGADHLGVENGHLTAIDPDDDRWEAVASTDPPDGDFPEGLVLNLSTTYCSRTLEREEPLALHDAPAQGWSDDPAYETHGLDCYLGVPVEVDGELYGTVCFVDEEPREEPFDDAETSFSDLVAHLVGHALERRRHEAALDRHERELRQRDQWFQGIVEASADVVFRLDTEAAFTFTSAPVEELLGYPPETLQGRSLATVLPEGEPLNRGTAAFQRVLDGDVVEETDLPLSTADGAEVYADVRAAPVRAAAEGDDEVVAVQGIVRDVTERRRHEQVIQLLNRVLRHNLRNDMTVARGLAETLAGDLNGEHATMADQLVATCDGLLKLSETARKLERVFSEGPSPQPVDIVVLVERAVERVRDAHPAADVELSTVEEAVVRASPAVETAVHELVDNAARHAGPEPAVAVEVRTVEEEVAVAVRDDGPGLPAQDRTVLETGDETPLHHGSGLGLWLVHWLVSSLDGEVSVQVDGGTTVRVAFPKDELAEESLMEAA